jgi:hypothetical protein
MAKLENEMGPFAFPIETIVYWSRLEGKGLRESFLIELRNYFEALQRDVAQNLLDVQWKRGDLNATYLFDAASQIDEVDIEIPLPHNIEDQVLRDLLEGAEEPVKPGGNEVN